VGLLEKIKLVKSNKAALSPEVDISYAQGSEVLQKYFGPKPPTSSSSENSHNSSRIFKTEVNSNKSFFKPHEQLTYLQIKKEFLNVFPEATQNSESFARAIKSSQILESMLSKKDLKDFLENSELGSLETLDPYFKGVVDLLIVAYSNYTKKFQKVKGCLYNCLTSLQSHTKELLSTVTPIAQKTPRDIPKTAKTPKRNQRFRVIERVLSYEQKLPSTKQINQKVHQFRNLVNSKNRIVRKGSAEVFSRSSMIREAKSIEKKLSCLNVFDRKIKSTSNNSSPSKSLKFLITPYSKEELSKLYNYKKQKRTERLKYSSLPSVNKNKL